MKKYLTYSAIDFTHDDHFLKWIKYPGENPQRDRFWHEWTAQHPEKAVEVEEAKTMILAVIEEKQYIPSENKQHEIWMRLQQSIKADDSPDKRKIFWSSCYKFAATVLLLFVLSSLVWWFSVRGLNDKSSLAHANDNLIKEFNNGNQPKTVVLGDGSSIVLEPQSSLEFPKVFDLESRKVWLTGEGFFQVSRDSKRPFVVYADKLITKVLGTSFTIRAFENEKKISVQVMTGNVSVSLESDAHHSKNKNTTQMEGVLLTPNQQVIFLRAESRMVKSLVEDPLLLDLPNKVNFEFNDTPLPEVFETLEQAYGIQIVYDEEAMQDCELNASLEGMSLYDKLRLICKGVNARYEILDSHIVISGKGCM